MAIQQLPFLNGLSTAADHMTTPPGFLYQMDDWQLDYGKLRPRYGNNIVNSTTFATGGGTQIDGIFYYYDSSKLPGGSNGSCVIVISGQKCYRAIFSRDSDWKTVSNISFTDITNSVALPQAPMTFDVLNNILVICGGNSTGTAPLQLTGSTVNIALLSGSPPSHCASVEVVNNFMFMATTWMGGPASTMSTFYWSNVGDPQTWNVASFQNYLTNDGDWITALGHIGNNLIIFKNNSIGMLNTQTTIISGAVVFTNLQTIFKGIGTRFPTTVENLPDGRIVFLGSDWNLWATDSVSLQQISKSPYPGGDVWNGGFSLDILPNPARNTTPAMAIYPTRNEIWISMVSASDASKTDVWAYDYLQNYWRHVTGMNNIRCFCVLPPYREIESVSLKQLSKQPYALLAGSYIASSGSPNVYWMDNNSIATPQDLSGNTITAVATLSVSDPSALVEQNFTSIDVPSSNSGSGTVWFGFDGTINGSSTKTLSSTTIRNTIPIPYKNISAVRPSSLQIQFQDTNSANTVYTPYLSNEIIS